MPFIESQIGEKPGSGQRRSLVVTGVVLGGIMLATLLAGVAFAQQQRERAVSEQQRAVAAIRAAEQNRLQALSDLGLSRANATGITVAQTAPNSEARNPDQGNYGSLALPGTANGAAVSQQRSYPGPASSSQNFGAAGPFSGGQQRFQDPRINQDPFQSAASAPQVIATQIQGYRFAVPDRRFSESDAEVQKLLNAMLTDLDEQKKAKLSEKIVALLTEEFEKRHSEQTERLDKVLADANRAAEILKQREEQKDEIVQRRLMELMGNRDPLNWNYQPNLPASSMSRLPQANNDPQATVPQTPGVPQFPQPMNAISGPASASLGPNGSLPPTQSPSPPSSGFYPSQRPPTEMESALRNAMALASGTPFDDNLANRLANAPSNAMPPASIDSGNWTGQDLVTAAYQVLDRQLDLARTQKLVARGLVSESDLSRQRNALQMAKAVWQMKQRELDAKLERVETELTMSKIKLEAAFQAAKAGDTNAFDLRLAESEVKLKMLELEAIRGQNEWTLAFKRTLAEAEAADDTEQEPKQEVSEQEVSADSSESDDSADAKAADNAGASPGE